jgi:hypothetical protein
MQFGWQNSLTYLCGPEWRKSAQPATAAAVSNGIWGRLAEAHRIYKQIHSIAAALRPTQKHNTSALTSLALLLLLQQIPPPPFLGWQSAGGGRSWSPAAVAGAIEWEFALCHSLPAAGVRWCHFWTAGRMTSLVLIVAWRWHTDVPMPTFPMDDDDAMAFSIINEIKSDKCQKQEKNLGDSHGDLEAI